MYDTQHSSSSFVLITRGQCITKFELLCTEIEVSFPALTSGSEHTCARPSAPRVLNEVHIQTFKSLVSWNVNTSESLEKATTSKRV